MYTQVAPTTVTAPTLARIAMTSLRNIRPFFIDPPQADRFSIRDFFAFCEEVPAINDLSAEG
jgi:hypothetical protein